MVAPDVALKSADPRKSPLSRSHHASMRASPIQRQVEGAPGHGRHTSGVSTAELDASQEVDVDRELQGEDRARHAKDLVDAMDLSSL